MTSLSSCFLNTYNLDFHNLKYILPCTWLHPVLVFVGKHYKISLFAPHEKHDEDPPILSQYDFLGRSLQYRWIMKNKQNYVKYLVLVLCFLYALKLANWRKTPRPPVLSSQVPHIFHVFNQVLICNIWKNVCTTWLSLKTQQLVLQLMKKRLTLLKCFFSHLIKTVKKSSQKRPNFDGQSVVEISTYWIFRFV